MTFKTDEQLRKYLTKNVEYDIGRRTWSFNGIKFTAWKGYFDGDFYTRVEYSCDLRKLTARLERGYECNRTFEIIAEKSFDREDAISQCIVWVVDRLIEVYKLLNERIAPYIYKKDLYQQAVSRPLNLQKQ